MPLFVGGGEGGERCSQRCAELLGLDGSSSSRPKSFSALVGVKPPKKKEGEGAAGGEARGQNWANPAPTVDTGTGCRGNVFIFV